MMLKYRIKKILKIIYYLLILVLSQPIKIFSKFRDVWIISERGNDARDNGFFLFQHIMKQNEGSKVYYIIDKKSSDYEKVRKYKNVINRGSILHYIFFSIASVKVSTHVMGYAPDIYLMIWLDKYNLVFGKKIFLQHGIINSFTPGLCYPNVKLDLFVCSAIYEYEYVLNNFNHPKGVIQYIGLPRFDNLYSAEKKKQILIMPTWRMFLNNISEEKFVESEYYKTFQQLINNIDLINIAKNKRYKIVFYPHYEFQKYINLFKSDSNFVEIASFENYDVQNLLKESEILITDYSSVHFDFAYMNKPVIYYQFDRKEFFQKHYQMGYFDYYTMGFGDVVHNINELILSLDMTISNNFILGKKYRNRIKKFFTVKDKNNCKRVYDMIKKL